MATADTTETVCSTCFDRWKTTSDRANAEGGCAMALTEDTKVKVAAGVYGDYVMNSEVGNSNPNFGYKPSLANETHEGWVEALLSWDDGKMANALKAVDVTDVGQLDEIIRTIKALDRDVAVAVYKKLRADIRLHRPAKPEAMSHDY